MTAVIYVLIDGMLPDESMSTNHPHTYRMIRQIVPELYPKIDRLTLVRRTVEQQSSHFSLGRRDGVADSPGEEFRDRQLTELNVH